LDFDVFKTRVEPIFLEKRPGHARCYAYAGQVPYSLQNTVPFIVQSNRG